MTKRTNFARLLCSLVFVAACFQPALANFPSGYYAHSKDVAKIHWQVYGYRAWSSIMLAQIEQESAWRKCPTSVVGARGLTQFMPRTQRAIERKYRLGALNPCKVEHAAMLQAYLMRDNARACGAVFNAFLDVWVCSLRIYNGSPSNFWKEHRAAGQPPEPFTQERLCGRFRSAAHCHENTEYWRRIILERWWPRYREAWSK